MYWKLLPGLAVGFSWEMEERVHFIYFNALDK